MDVVHRSIVGLHESRPAVGDLRIERVAFPRLAVALTSAAALAGLIEVLVDRLSAPAIAGALGDSAVVLTGALVWIGTIAVSMTAVLVLLATAAWSAHLWDQQRVFALAAMSAVVASVAAGLSTSRTVVFFVHVSVSVAAGAYLAMSARRAAMPLLGAIWAVSVAVVAGQWSLSGLGGSATLAGRAVGEAALVLAVISLALAVFRSSRGGPAPLLGLAVGALLGALSLASDYTPFAALWATGAMLWLPSLVYVAAAAAAGCILAASVVDRAARRLSAALILLAVAGLEPTLVHHNVTALLALLALGTFSDRGGISSWR